MKDKYLWDWKEKRWRKFVYWNTDLVSVAFPLKLNDDGVGYETRVHKNFYGPKIRVLLD